MILGNCAKKQLAMLGMELSSRPFTGVSARPTRILWTKVRLTLSRKVFLERWWAGLKFKTCQIRESQWKLRCSTEFWVGSHKTAYDPDVAIAEKMHFPIWDDIFVHRKYYRNKQTKKNSVTRKKRCRLKFGYS